MWNYDYKNLQEEEEEIEFILFSLCAFEKSLDLGCNFIIIFFIQAGNKAKCIVQNQRKRKDFFRNEKK